MYLKNDWIYHTNQNDGGVRIEPPKHERNMIRWKAGKISQENHKRLVKATTQSEEGDIGWT